MLKSFFKLTLAVTGPYNSINYFPIKYTKVFKITSKTKTSILKSILRQKPKFSFSDKNEKTVKKEPSEQ